MSELSANSPVNWNLTAETNAQGRTYIKAYKMCWDKVAKKPKRAMRRHVGRLMPNDSIAMSEKFLIDHPQYAGQQWFWGANKRPVLLEEYLNDFPRKPGLEVDEEENALLPTLNVGLTWAAVEIAKSHGILEHLVEVFGKQLGKKLLYLAIYKLAGGTSMMTFDLWRQQNWLPEDTPLSGQKISEILAAVKIWEKIFEKKSELKGQKIEYALDSTSISTYTESIAEAQYGHAKRNPDLKQVNFTVVCDQRTSDVVFAHLYDGAVNDSSSLLDVLMLLQEARFDLSRNILVTDRGYSTLMNVQKMLNLELSFLQGVRITEDAIELAFDKHMEALKNGAFYDGDLGVCAYTYAEDWQQNCSCGRLNAKVKVHLYRMDKIFDEQRALIWKKTSEIISLLKAARRVPSDLWEAYRRFIKERVDDQGRKLWALDTTKMDQTAERASHFVLRSNCINDPFEALRIYRARGLVERDFNQLKNWVNGDRLRVGARSLQGKVFVTALAAGLRMIMMSTAKRVQSGNSQLKIPNNSIDSLIKNLELVRADKRKNANAWVRNTIPDKRRRLFELLELREPPRVFRVGSM